MDCKFCGNKLIEGSRFCLSCGMPIDFNESEEEKFAKETEEREKVKLRDRKINMIFGVSLPIICIIVLFLFFYILFFSENKIDLNVTLQESEVTKTLEETNQGIVNKPNVFVGDSFESKSYIVTFKDILVIDKDSENSILYNVTTGKEYVLLNVMMENLTYSDVVYSSITNFKAYLDGDLINPSYSGVLAENFTSLEGSNKRKSSRDGYLAYNVPQGWKKLVIDIGIDGLENEPVLCIENPKNRNISEDELKKIWETYEINDFLYENDLGYLDDEDINACIVDFMHKNCLDRHDYIPIQKLNEEIKKLN